MRIILIAAVAAILASCAGTPETRATVALASACGLVGTLMDELAPYVENGTLSDDTVALVKGAQTVTRPACKADSDIDPAEAVGVVRGAADTLSTIYRRL